MQKSAILSIRVRKKKIQAQVTRALPRREDRAWLAGIIEGEGSVLWASYGNDEWRAKISVIMNDGAVIAYAAKLMGATPFYDKKRKRWHTYAEGFRAIQVAKLAGPHMRGQKKELAFAMVTAGHVFRGREPPWRFKLAYDNDLQKNVRTLELSSVSRI
ncbi:MAG: hypothetical protein AUI50_07210 [Crenarchaeota archaeon 13_1_40CM_2_52_14]|nr:MAG: hypothetical protein AUI97_01700 [Crenarchaeota archaeon 13_1_40CM_3_52_17]OLD34252.1 MAG: hypothetical protein AUI50_07210 [Crenarchaeota archaeon 13_1_40CM_2_52_14]OLE71651.1 MAG: hypothetical protein AUF78_01030 [archaeon 13_1_20CM_2_51_12]